MPQGTSQPSSGTFGEIVCACSLMRRDPARPSGPAGGLCVAQGPGLDGARPDRDFGRSAGMRRTALPDLQLRSHDRGIGASGHDPRQAATAGVSGLTRSSCWHRTRTTLPPPIRLARVWAYRTSNSSTTWLMPRKISCARMQRQQAFGNQPGCFSGAAEPFHQPPPLLAIPDHWTNLRVQVDAA